MRDAEAMLVKHGLGNESIVAASRAAMDAVEPTSDPNASADYRRHLTGVLAERALLRAARMLKEHRHG